MNVGRAKRCGGFWPNLSVLMRLGLRLEWAEKDRVVAPLMFGIVAQVMFGFGIGSLSDDVLKQLFTAQCFLVLFLALQISLSRTFEAELGDRIFDQLRIEPISYDAWFVAKSILVVLTSLLIALPTLAVAQIFYGRAIVDIDIWPIVAIVLFAVGGLAPLGVLLASITMRSPTRQLVFPLLFFPLTAPILLAGIEAANIFVSSQGAGVSNGWNWLWFIGSFDVIYATLGFLLFKEVVRSQ